MKNNSITRRQLLKTAVSAGILTGCPLLSSPLLKGESSTDVLEKEESLPIFPDNPAIEHLPENCISCGRCRGFCYDVTAVFGHKVPKGEEACIHCGQCTLFCQTDALVEKVHFPDLVKALDEKKTVICSTSPAIRVSLGEMFGMPPGMDVEGKTIAALKAAGVDYVLDTTFAADLTVMEEAAELLKRLEKNNEKKPLPMFSSCCPAWVRFAKLFYPKFLPNISTTKSPVMIQGAMVKSFFAQKLKIKPEDIFHAALTPCTAKKGEILLAGMDVSGDLCGNSDVRDVDAVLTCRELAYFLAQKKIKFREMPDAAYDSVMGLGSGAGMIFGNTGGVTEAVLRTAYYFLNGKNPPDDFYKIESISGTAAGRRAAVDLGKRKLNVAAVHGIANVRPLLAALEQGKADFDFIEVMACPGGCIGGGGQPKDLAADTGDILLKRRAGLFKRDTNNPLRLSYENPEIKAVYKEFLGEPLSGKSEKMLHLDFPH
ncbi:hydrogenase [Planctomycetales bacterium]|nr:hydrogenase [Planctomycetales bacterium]GHT37261.1 hydrogenase [Planctomycetales bacterium]